MGKKSLSLITLPVVSVFCIILAFSMFRHSKGMEADFNDQKAVFIKKNMDLEDHIGSLQEEVIQKKEALTIFEEKSKTLTEEYAGEIEALKEENAALAARATEPGEKPLTDLIEESMEKEENENVKKFLEETLQNLKLVKSGRDIELEPATLSKKREAQEEPQGGPERSKQALKLKAVAELDKAKTAEIPQPSLPLAEKSGRILSVDKRYSLIIISLGRREDVKEDDECVILRNGEEIGLASVISVRYKVSAAFLDEVKYGYDVRRIKEGDEVLIMK